jgi:hypothetical protein
MIKLPFSMPAKRCDECGVLSALKSKSDVLKLTESCSLEDGYSRCNPCSKFATLQAQVQVVEKTLLNLKAAQQSLISDINFHHSHFIRDIPNEVVGLIFSFCHDPAPRRSKESQSRRFCMLTLGAVCKKWREIAWATPELWTFLRMPDVPEGSSPSFSRQVELAQEWLGRTANLPLDISLETQLSSRNPNTNPHIGRLLETLNSYSGRWRCLDICIPKMYLPLFNYLPSETAQQDPEGLQHLRLDGFRLTKSRVSFNTHGEFLKPTKVTLGPLFVRFLNIHWGNVTSLTCSALFIDECFELLRLAPKVTEFVVGVTGGHDNHPIPSAPLIHSQLRKLAIRHHLENTMDFLFSKLTLPSLESFTYGISSALTIQSNTLIELLVRSHPPLRHLSLAKILMDNRNFIDLMISIPQLEELEILFEEPRTSFDYFLAQLGITHTSNHSESSSDLPFLPRLRSLKYQYIGDQLLPFDLFPTAFGKGVVSPENATGNETFRRPLQTLTIAIERPPYRYVTGVKYQRPILGKAIIECLLNLIEKEGKTIEISHTGVDLLQPCESVDMEDSGTGVE